MEQEEEEEEEDNCELRNKRFMALMERMGSACGFKEISKNKVVTQLSIHICFFLITD